MHSYVFLDNFMIRLELLRAGKGFKKHMLFLLVWRERIIEFHKGLHVFLLVTEL